MVVSFERNELVGEGGGSHKHTHLREKRAREREQRSSFGGWQASSGWLMRMEIKKQTENEHVVESVANRASVGGGWTEQKEQKESNSE